MRNQLTLIILLATCGIALGPIIVELVGPRSKARWLLAQAANDYESGSIDAAKSNLEKAAEISSEVAVDPEYWNLRFEIAFGKEKSYHSEATELFEDAKLLLPGLPSSSRIAIARQAAVRLKQEKRIDMAIGLMEACFPPKESRTPIENNDLAYFRALAKTDLEIGLEEIDIALRTNSNAELLDTKAWILHRLGRNQTAIEWADAGILRIYEEIKKGAGANKATLAVYQLLEPDQSLSADESNKDSSKVTTINVGSDRELKNKDSVDSDKAVAVETTKASSSDESSSPSNAPLISPIDQLRNQYPSINIESVAAIAKNIAVMRFHRACILDELNRTSESERDYVWLDRFGFSETQKLE